MNKKIKGITLIALIITIIVLLILAGVTIHMIFGDSGLFAKANEAKFKTMMSGYREDVNLYTSWKVTETMNTDTSGINSGDPLKEAIEQEVVEGITTDDVNIAITDIIKDIKNDAKDYVAVYGGEIYYVSSKKVSNNDKQVKWCEDLGIKVLEIRKEEGIVVRNGNYELIDGIYVCTPKLNEGFNTKRTRYLELNDQGNLTPKNWVDQKPTDNWYSYRQRKWANIVVEDGGTESYYTWIPRYCFTLDQDGQRSNVKFIDCNNKYKDENGNETSWEELQAEGYKIPEAFTFDGQELPGYWAMKYTAGDINTPSTINYEMSVSKGKITVKNITLNTTITNNNPIAKYTIALNGKIAETITDASKSVVLENLKAGNNTINVTGLNAGGEIVGSMTKEYEPAVVNKPDLSGFNPETTFYVTYDDNENEHSTVPITQSMPENWYEYGESRWANIVTRNNGKEIYYTWVPRYCFTLDQTNQKSTVKFLSETSSEVPSGYKIPEAFTFDGKQLSGYWAMKYTAGDETAPTFETEVVSTSGSIKTKGITGSKVASGQVYKYYINGEYKGEKTSANDWFEYTGLSADTKYTILIEIRNSSDEYIGTISKQITTIDANKPDLTGFAADCTYYVEYDENENEKIGDKIKNDGSNAPKDWYDYSSSKWANIVVKADGKTTYYTWIPRYEFLITGAQQAQIDLARTEVRFLKDTSTDTSSGYKIPEAFTFDGKELSGYWAMKYTAGE